MSKEIKVYFVLPSDCNSDENLTSEPMRRAFELCCQNQLIPEWISEENCITQHYGKTDIIVFDEFKGEAFKQLETKKCFSISGPWCLITCLLEGLQVPNNGAAVYNMAMHKLTITASNYSAERKKIMKEKIEMMGGIFTIHITANVTHLVTNCVRTQKYAVANERNIKIMLESWIDDVWNVNLSRNIKATDDEFLKHKCPIFESLRLCCTGFEVNERNRMIKLITDNGGSYSGKFVSSSTDILICNPGVPSEKFNVARKAKVPCLKIDWVYDSIERGYCLPDHDYIIKISSSTPTKNNAPLNIDFSMMSAISGCDNNDPFKSCASDTINVSLYNMDHQKKQSVSDSSVDKENKLINLIDAIDLKQVKQAGLFLTECSIYLSGFNGEKREKLCRILKCAGATRYDHISDRVTQIITGTNHLESNEIKLLKGSIIPIVTIEWLIECIKQRQPVYEEPFTIKSNTVNAANTLMPSSPLSQKGLTLLQHDTTSKGGMLPPPQVVQAASIDAGANIDQDLSQLYLKQCKTNPEEDTLAKLLYNQQIDTNHKISRNSTTSQEQFDDDTYCAIFEGKTFKLIGQNNEDLEKLKIIIEEHEGDIIPANSKAITDYIVVPPISNPLSLKYTATEIVNHLWIYECQAEQSLVSLKYYHQPVYKANSPLNVLEDCVITISGYASSERTYLMNLIQYLGAIYQDKFARVTLPDQSVRASTHLICLEASGSKYSAAVRWKRPAVTHNWLLKCTELKTKCDETEYSLTNTAPVILPPPPPPPVNISNKRDIEGKRISPLPNELNADLNNIERCENNETPGKRKKSEHPIDDNLSFLCSGGNNQQEDGHGSPEIEVDDGRKVTLNKFMQELRDQGLFDTPSPAPKLNAGTPITEVFARLRREGKIPSKAKLNVTPEHHKLTSANAKEPGSGGSGGRSGSQGTPIGRYIRSLQERNVIQTTPKSSTKNAGSSNLMGSGGTSESPVVRPFYDVKTPETPLGRFLGEDDPSRETRKHWQRYIDTFPHYKCHDRPASTTQRRPSTPWSEVKKQAWAWLLRDKNDDNSQTQSDLDKNDEQVQVQVQKEQSETQKQLSNQIDQIQDRLRQQNKSNSGRNSILHLDGSTPQKIASDNEQYSSKISALHDVKDSQANTVEWDDPIESNIFQGHMTGEISNNDILRKFMLSALEPNVRVTCNNTIKSLGGEVSDLGYYDHSSTHVVCSNPTRNEKILASMAAGKWIVHYTFIEDSGQSGSFLNEELYEFGNPKSSEKLGKVLQTTPTMEAMHWWRLNVLEKKRGAFDGMRALIFSKNKLAIVRLIEAGGGVILNAEPPFDHRLDVTHCFIDTKLKMNPDTFVPLAEQGILCLNVLYLSSYLNNKSNTNTNEFIITPLKDYYK